MWVKVITRITSGLIVLYQFPRDLAVLRRAKVELELEAWLENRFIVDRWNFGVPLFHQNSSEITDVRYGTGVRQTHTCTFSRDLDAQSRRIICDLFLSKLVRARSCTASYTTTGASIDREFFIDVLLSSDCTDTAWIRFKRNQSGERPSFSPLRFETESRPSFVSFLSFFRVFPFCTLLAIAF